MRKVFLSAGVILGVLVLPYVCFSATRDAALQVTSKPVFATVIGTTNAVLQETRYPVFSNIFGVLTACSTQATDSNDKPMPSPNLDGPIWQGGTNPFSDSFYRFVPMSGTTTITIPERNRRDSKILVSWTLDIIENDLIVAPFTTAQPPAVPLLNPPFSSCAPCTNCGAAESFGGGNVYVQVFVSTDRGVSYAKQGQRIVYSIPGVTMRNWYIPSPPPPPNSGDPTCSGSFILDRANFGGMLPQSIDIRLGWYNDSSRRLKAPANRRVINVFIEPIG